MKQDDRLPQQMCSQCLVCLSQVYRFMRTCLQTEKMLRTCLDAMGSRVESEQMNEANLDVAQPEELIITITSDNESSGGKEEEVILKPVSEVTDKLEVCLKQEVGTEEQKGHTYRKRYDFRVVNAMKEAGTFDCSLCPKRFFRKEHLMLHLNTHKKEKFYECHHCCKKFKFKPNLHRHILIHEGKKMFKCELCGKGEKLSCSWLEYLRSAFMVSDLPFPLFKENISVLIHLKALCKAIK